MTTPEVPDDRTDQPTAEQPAIPPTTESGPAQPTAEQPVEHRAGPPIGPPPGPPPWAYPPVQPYPFAPRAREPWVNPAKRSTFGLVAVVLALVLLGGGFVIGAAVAHRHDGNHSQLRRGPAFEGQPGFRAPQRGQRMPVRPGRVNPGQLNPGRRTGKLPGNGQFRPPTQRVVPPATPSPAPSSSHS